MGGSDTRHKHSRVKRAEAGADEASAAAVDETPSMSRVPLLRRACAAALLTLLLLLLPEIPLGSNRMLKLLELMRSEAAAASTANAGCGALKLPLSRPCSHESEQDIDIRGDDDAGDGTATDGDSDSDELHRDTPASGTVASVMMDRSHGLEVLSGSRSPADASPTVPTAGKIAGAALELAFEER